MWIQASEAHSLQLSRSGTKNIKCKFSRRHTNSSFKVKIRDNIIPYATKF